MIDTAVKIALFAFWGVLMIICIWMIWQIYKVILDLIRELCKELVTEIYEEGKYEEEQEEIGCSGETEGRAVVPGSNGGYAQKEEEGKCTQKK